MSQQLFVAVELTEEVIEALTLLQSALRAWPGAEQVRWVDPRGTHLTLKFLGETEERLLPEIEAALSDNCQHFEPVALHLVGVGAFPNPRRPRVLWVGLNADQSLAMLQVQIERSLARLGFPREERAFSPHLTLGRVREGCRSEAALGLERMLAGAPPVPAVEFIAAEVSLMRSVLGPAGAVYTRLFAAPLCWQDAAGGRARPPSGGEG